MGKATASKTSCPAGDPAGLACTLRALPDDKQAEAAATAVAMNPANNVRLDAMASIFVAVAGGADALDAILAGPGRLAFINRYWGPKGVKLGVRFLDNPTAAFKSKFLAHANSWGEFSNVHFAESASGEVRVARARGGYWSYLGTDVLSIPAGRATMNLEAFTERTPEEEWTRVVRHEVGHTLGCPHEHMRRDIIAELDEAKVISYFRRTQGWSEQEVRRQVLTPLEERDLIGSPVADQTSIMTYQLPGSITKSGKPILGGLDFSVMDREHAAKVYPRPEAPPPPPPQPSGLPARLVAYDAAGKELGAYRIST